MFKLLDSTLREGEQTPGVNFSIAEKVEIARLLDQIGTEMIEAGDPSVSTQVLDAIQQISALGLNAEILAHSLATKAGIDKAKMCGVDRVVVVYPTSKIHLEIKVNKTEDEVLQVIQEHVQYARSLDLKVRFTPEDATRAEPGFLVKACNAAILAGADRISFADTLGIMQPHQFYEMVKDLKERLLPCEIDVHCHNDFGLALANAMAGVRAGATCIHVSVNGMGERAGISDLAETILAYHVLEHVEKYDLKQVTALARFVERVTGFQPAPNKPVTGANAFSHKSGVHSNGVLKNPKTYEPFDPGLMGRTRTIIIDRYTGEAAVKSKLAEYGFAVNDAELSEIVTKIKESDDGKKVFQDADILKIAEQVTGERK